MTRHEYDVTHGDWKSKKRAEAKKGQSIGCLIMVLGPVAGMVACFGAGPGAFLSLTVLGLLGGGFVYIMNAMEEKSLE